MKALVTGGNGFFGTWLVKALLDKGFDVRVLHRASSHMASLHGLAVESCIGDVCDFESVAKAVKGVDVVFHAAGLVSYSSKDREAMEKINVGGTVNVANACLGQSCRLILTSSVVAVGASLKPEILNEESPFTLHPFNLGYYETKLASEEYVIEKAKARQLNAIVLNPGVMFGAGDAQKSSRKTHLKVAKGQFPFYPAGGVSVLHVADAVQAHVDAVEKGRVGERYILGGENLKTLELFKMLSGENGCQAPKIPLPTFFLRGAFRAEALAQKGGLPVDVSEKLLISTLYHWYDSSKAKKELGYSPRDAKSAIKESLQWAQTHHYI